MYTRLSVTPVAVFIKHFTVRFYSQRTLFCEVTGKSIYKTITVTVLQSLSQGRRHSLQPGRQTYEIVKEIISAPKICLRLPPSNFLFAPSKFGNLGGQ